MVYLGKTDYKITEVLINHKERCLMRLDFEEKTIKKAREYLGS